MRRDTPPSAVFFRGTIRSRGGQGEPQAERAEETDRAHKRGNSSIARSDYRRRVPAYPSGREPDRRPFASTPRTAAIAGRSNPEHAARLLLPAGECWVRSKSTGY